MRQDDFSQDPILVKYLLGDDLDADIERQIEERSKNDSQFSEQVLALEDDLIASYLRGDLTGRHKRLFEERFLVSQRRQNRLSLFSSLLTYARAGHGLPTREPRRRHLMIFVCGTYEDLAEERQAVLETVRRLKLRHDSMEFFGARANKPIATCLEEVADSDVVVLILGYRYGTIVPELGVSFSEAEYQEAFRRGKPCLVYLRDESVPILPRFVERDPQKLRLLERFRALLLDRHTVARFKSSGDLAARVAVDIEETLNSITHERSREAAHDQAKASRTVDSHIGQLVDMARAEGMNDVELVAAVRRGIVARLVVSGRRRPLIYVCRGNESRELASALHDALSSHNLDFWEPPDVDGNDREWLDKVSAVFDEADLIVVLISAGLLQSTWSRSQFDLIVARRVATSRGRVVLPVIVDASPVPAALRDVKAVDVHLSTAEEAAAKIRDVVVAYLIEQGSAGI